MALPESPGKRVVIATFENEVEAQIRVAFLASAGIDASLADERFAAMGLLAGQPAGTVKLLVPEADVDRAGALLDEKTPADADSEAE